jgi:hypothetical protein
MSSFKVKIEIRPQGDIRTITVDAANPQSAADKVREQYKNQQIVVVTVKREKVAA